MPTIHPIKDKATQLEIERHFDMLKFPTGSIVFGFFDPNNPPYGWISTEKAQWLDKQTYANLFTVIKNGIDYYRIQETEDKFRLARISSGGYSTIIKT